MILCKIIFKKPQKDRSSQSGDNKEKDCMITWHIQIALSKDEQWHTKYVSSKTSD